QPIAAAAIAATLGSLAFAAKIAAPSFNPDRYLATIKYLASPEMKGRESGTPELEKAAQYIAAQFKSAGLKPLDSKSYLQPFEITTSAKLGHGNRFEYTSGGDQKSLEMGKEFVPFNFSAH